MSEISTSHITKALREESKKRYMRVKRIERKGDQVTYKFSHLYGYPELTSMVFTVDVSQYEKRFAAQLADQAYYEIKKNQKRLRSEFKRLMNAPKGEK